MSLILDEHREFLSDRFRLQAFESALRATIKPEHVVLDLGSGSGILGLLAARAGARHVYSIDNGAILQVAREIGAANQFADRITYLKGMSTRIDLPELADVVIADQIGHFGFEAGIFEYFKDAHARLLKPNAITIPAAVELHIAPVTAPDIQQRIEFWESPVMGFDFTAARPIARNSGYPARLRSDQLLGAPAVLLRADLSGDTPYRMRAEATLRIERDGTLHGIGGWFSADLAPGVTMTNSPLSDQRIDRRNTVLPIDRPVEVRKGDELRVAMSIVPSEVMLSWRVEIIGRNSEAKGVFNHSSLRGMLLWREDLAKMRSDRVPVLTSWGTARQSVLQLCDGRRKCSEIETALHARHPELFRTAADAAEFVAEVLVAYSA